MSGVAHDRSASARDGIGGMNVRTLDTTRDPFCTGRPPPMSCSPYTPWNARVSRPCRPPTSSRWAATPDVSSRVGACCKDPGCADNAGRRLTGRPHSGRERDAQDVEVSRMTRSADQVGHAVVIAGGGPTGLMLAAELTLAGVDVVVVERRANQDLDGSRAGGLHSRTIEILDQRGVVERFLSAGQQHPFAGYAGIVLDITDFPTRHNYLLALWQRDFERILSGWIEELGVPILRQRAVVGLAH